MTIDRAKTAVKLLHAARRQHPNAGTLTLKFTSDEGDVLIRAGGRTLVDTREAKLLANARRVQAQARLAIAKARHR